MKTLFLCAAESLRSCALTVAMALLLFIASARMSLPAQESATHTGVSPSAASPASTAANDPGREDRDGSWRNTHPRPWVCRLCSPEHTTGDPRTHAGRWEGSGWKRREGHHLVAGANCRRICLGR